MLEMREPFLALMAIPERPEDALDPSVFSGEALAAGEKIYHDAFMNPWRLPVPHNRDERGLETFLVRRMMLREVDCRTSPCSAGRARQRENRHPRCHKAERRALGLARRSEAEKPFR